MAEIKIPMFQVESSNIKAIGYHPGTRTLRIQFKGMATHDFKGPGPEVFSKFMASESKGRFFFTEIKGKYDSEKIAFPVK